MQTIKMKRQSVKQIKSGNPLIVAQDILGTYNLVDGDILTLIDGTTKEFLAKAYVGHQHKGVAWVFTNQQSVEFETPFFQTLFKRAWNKRQAMDLSSSAYRLFNGEGDGLGGVTIDWYDGVAVVSFYSYGIFKYHEQLIEALISEVPDCLAVYEKCRFKQSPYESRFVWGQETPRVLIEENGVNYATYMDDGLMTGIFLDQREVREYIKQQVTDGQTVLNTFSYTGAFSVSAAVGGASRTVSVDVAKRSIEKTTEQFQLNQIEMTNHALYVMDVFDYMKYAVRKNMTFDWVILDPPSFARTKKRTFSVMKDYKDLLQEAIAITAKRGHIVISTNASNMNLKSFEQMIDQACLAVHQPYTIEKTFRLPEDFTILPDLEQTNYLKVYVITLR